MNFIIPARRSITAHTLAEVLVAVLILATMIISLCAGFSTGFALALLGREDERATQIMTQQVEAARFCRWSALTNFPVTASQEYYDPANTASLPVYSITNSLEIPNALLGGASYTTNMRLLTVTVSWTTQNRTNKIVRTRKMQTLVARYGVQNHLWGLAP